MKAFILALPEVLAPLISDHALEEAVHGEFIK
jgi:hypothetical protein